MPFCPFTQLCRSKGSRLRLQVFVCERSYVQIHPLFIHIPFYITHMPYIHCSWSLFCCMMFSLQIFYIPPKKKVVLLNRTKKTLKITYIHTCKNTTQSDFLSLSNWKPFHFETNCNKKLHPYILYDQYNYNTTYMSIKLVYLNSFSFHKNFMTITTRCHVFLDLCYQVSRTTNMWH